MRQAVAVAVATALLAAGCSSSGGSKADDPVISAPANSTAAGATSAAPPASSIATTAAAATSSPAPSSTAASTPAASSSHVTVPPAAPRSTCTKLTIRAIQGGAAGGQEIAALQFTNDGSTACDLYGYPSVTLLLNGRPLGRPSQPSSTATSHRSLAPGATAESLLHNYVTNCQAPLSDNVRLVAPGSSQTLVRPLQLRACLLRVDPLGAPN